MLAIKSRCLSVLLLPLYVIAILHFEKTHQCYIIFRTPEMIFLMPAVRLSWHTSTPGKQTCGDYQYQGVKEQ